jgi:hypothetical protein
LASESDRAFDLSRLLGSERVIVAEAMSMHRMRRFVAPLVAIMTSK